MRLSRPFTEITDADLTEMKQLREAEYATRLEFLWEKFAYLLRPKTQGEAR